MKTWNMVIDVARCHDCNNCFLADKDEFVGNDFPPSSAAQPWSGHRWMNIERKERGTYPLVQVAYLPLSCQHCDNPRCIDESPAGTVYKRDDGLVIIDPEKAKGHPEIVDTCPYGAIYWNEELQLAQKCTGCAHLLDEGWTETRCTMICPTGSLKLVVGDDDEMQKLVAAEGLETYRSELGTKPRVFFKNLHKWTKVFIAGSAVFEDTDECGEGARVTVEGESVFATEAVANNYGEFLIDRLDPGKEYTVRIDAPGYRTFVKTVRADESVNLGTIVLSRQ
jgi:Fe-S-cluster-containing dehydrogenase component